jgi:hypothetical protein
MSPIEYFFKAYTIKSVLNSEHAEMGFKCLACLVQEKINMKFLLVSSKTLLIQKIAGSNLAITVVRQVETSFSISFTKRQLKIVKP